MFIVVNNAVVPTQVSNLSFTKFDPTQGELNYLWPHSCIDLKDFFVSDDKESAIEIATQKSYHDYFIIQISPCSYNLKNLLKLFSTSIEKEVVNLKVVSITPGNS
jgi:hypothetical protein